MTVRRRRPEAGVEEALGWTRDAVAILQDPSRAPRRGEMDAAVALLDRAVGAADPDGTRLAGRLSNLSGALQLRYARFDDEADLDASIEAARRAVDLTRPDAAPLPAHAGNLAASLRLRYDLRGRLDDLDGSIKACRTAIAASAEADPRLPGRLANLCNALRTRWERLGRQPDLDDAERAGRRAAGLAGFGDSAWAAIRSNLGSTLYSRYETSGDLAALREAVAVGRQCLAATGDDDVDAAGRRSNVVLMLLDLYEETGDLACLDEAVTTSRRAMELADRQPRNRAAILSSSSRALLTRHEAFGRPVDLADGLAAARSARLLVPAGHPVRSAVLLNWANALQIDFEATGATDRLDEAVSALDEALGAAADDRSRGPVWNGLCVCLRLRAGERTAPADLDRAVEAGREAVRAGRRRTGEHLATALANLSGALQARYEQEGEPEDLSEAYELAEEAVHGTALDHPLRPRRSSSVVNALRLQFEASGDDGLLDAFLRHAEAVVAATRREGPERSGRLMNLALAQLAGAGRRGDAGAAAAAVATARSAMGGLPEGHPLLRRATGTLSLGLHAVYELTGAPGALDDAITTGTTAAELAPEGHPEQAQHLSNLGLMLLGRWELRGAAADLDAALAVLRRSVATTPVQDVRRAGRLSNLSGAHLDRFRLDGVDLDAAEAVRSAEAALATTPPGHADRPMYLNRLAIALDGLADVPHAEQDAGPGDTDPLLRARAAIEEAVGSTPRQDPRRPILMSNRAGILMRIFERDGTDADLDAALDSVREAVEETDPRHPNRTAYLSNLGRVQAARFEKSGDEAARRAAEDAYAEAAGVVAAAPTERTRAARTWTGLAASRQDWPTAVRAVEAGVEQLARSIGRGLARRDKERRLAAGTGLPALAAAVALRAGHPELALELAEQGRGLLIQQTLDLRVDTGALDRETADRFAALRDQLERPVPAGAETKQFSYVRVAAAEATVLAERRAVADEFDALMTDIRGRGDVGRLFQTARAADLSDIVGEGTAAVMNVHDLGSDAVLLGATGVTRVRLPRLTQSEVEARAVRLLEAVEVATDADEPPADRIAAEAEIGDVLAWLWDSAAEPVLGQVRPGSHLWWSPTGALSYLPLHAAGRHGDAGRDTVLDRVVSSYAPTMRALTHTRRPARSAGRVGVVAMPTTPDAAPLPHALEEARLVSRTYGRGVRVLTGRRASRAAVLDLLRTRPVVHFACHGVNDLQLPSQSRLLIQDHLNAALTVEDLVELDLPDAQLAYLSACTTARPGVRLLDESIHLAAGFQLAGYRHVVGTMWPVYDRGALRMAADVHRRLAGDQPSGAVHAATLALRDRAVRRPSTWAGYVHYGA